MHWKCKSFPTGSNARKKGAYTTLQMIKECCAQVQKLFVKSYIEAWLAVQDLLPEMAEEKTRP